MNLETGDTVLLTTDGVLEARSPGGQMFGAERMLQVVRGHCRSSASEIIGKLHQAIRDFTGQGLLTDDTTVVVIKVGAPGQC
jgi:sigma-B regulation protein RsbU (phosphoserine phosphatase)